MSKRFLLSFSLAVLPVPVFTAKKRQAIHVIQRAAQFVKAFFEVEYAYRLR